MVQANIGSNAQKLLERVRLSKPSLEGLLAVLGRSSDDGFLLLYNCSSVPEGTTEWVCRHWRALDAEAFQRYDGPVLAVGGASLLLPNVPASGADFHPLEPLFDGSWDILRENYRQLVLSALAHSPTLAGLAANVVLRMNLHKVAPSFGIALSPNLAESLDGFPPGAICWDLAHSINDWVVLARETLEQGGWIASFEEMRLIYPHIDCPGKQWIDLRPLLRDTQSPAYRDALIALSRRAYARWKETGQPPPLRAAYAIATEARLLPNDDSEDLLANSTSFGL